MYVIVELMSICLQILQTVSKSWSIRTLDGWRLNKTASILWVPDLLISSLLTGILRDETYVHGSQKGLNYTSQLSQTTATPKPIKAGYLFKSRVISYASSLGTLGSSMQCLENLEVINGYKWSTLSNNCSIYLRKVAAFCIYIHGTFDKCMYIYIITIYMYTYIYIYICMYIYTLEVLDH